MCITADGFNALSNTPCLIENNALLAFRLKFVSATENLAVFEKVTQRYLY